MQKYVKRLETDSDLVNKFRIAINEIYAIKTVKT